MSKAKEKGAKPGAEAEADVRYARFVPSKVTKGAVRFVEATATGKPKTQSKSVWRNMYARLFDAEGAIGEEYLDDEGNLTIKALNVTIEIEA